MSAPDFGQSVHSPLEACVSICYDGADLSHLETAIPCLSEFGLKGTFFLLAPELLEHASSWQAAMNEGHEIGSHALLDAADERGNLARWTLEMVEEELRSNRKLLAELFPRQLDFSFAYPGADTECMTVAYNPQPTSYRPAVANVFDVARSAFQGFNNPAVCNLAYLRSISVAGHSASEMIAITEHARREQEWVILVIGGVGSGEDAIDAREHRTFCAWLSEHQKTLHSETVWRHAFRIRANREAPEHGALMHFEEAEQPPVAPAE